MDPRDHSGRVATGGLAPYALLVGSGEQPTWTDTVFGLGAATVVILALTGALKVASKLRADVRRKRAIGDTTASLSPSSGDAHHHGIGQRVAGCTCTWAESALVRVLRDRGASKRVQPTLEGLVRLASLARDRIASSDQTIRHTNDARYRTLVQNSADAIIILDDVDRIRYATPSASTLFRSLDLESAPLIPFLNRQDRESAADLLRRTRAGTDGRVGLPGAVEANTDWTVRADGNGLTQVTAWCQDFRSDPSIQGLVVTLRDVTEQRRLERELARQAVRDPLTGLTNRRPFNERLESVVQQARTTDEIAGVMFIDLDDLKKVNDSLGHEAGDVVLIAVGERLRRFVASETGVVMASRLGGDEFAVLVSGVAQPALDLAAARLGDILEQPVSVEGNEIMCGASVGVATTADAVAAPDVLRNADIALYSAKGAGKRQWRRYESWMREPCQAVLRSSPDSRRSPNDRCERVPNGRSK